jgi:hypothetical protein
MTSAHGVALMVSRGFCWAAPGAPCGDDGQHLARYLRASRRGLIGREALGALCEPLPHVSAGQVIPDAVEVPRGGRAPGRTPHPGARLRQRARTGVSRGVMTAS